MKIKWEYEKVCMPPDFRAWHYAPFGKSTNVEWVCVRDENPSCKHNKLVCGEVEIFKDSHSKDIYRIIRHWICRECYAIGIDAFESTDEIADDEEVHALFKEHNKALYDCKFESSEGMEIEFNETENE